MTLVFEWDAEKAAANRIKHGISFELAAHVFYDPSRIDRYDDRENYGEERFLTIGLVGQMALIVAYTMRGDTIRIISARKADRHEQGIYWENR